MRCLTRPFIRLWKESEKKLTALEGKLLEAKDEKCGNGCTAAPEVDVSDTGEATVRDDF